MRQALREFFRPFSSHRLAEKLVIALSVFAVLSGSASAAATKYSAIVVDARTGKVLHAENADARRFPASLTKMMTLYLTFEALASGKIRKSSPVVFSVQAATQPPTKIGVKAGQSITVETAIYALVTRSANDASMALAELLGGSQQNFARMMTAKARALGMRGTMFRNPNGLPDPGQFTTARDMATLGIALRRDFPQYYGYFAVKSFKYGRTRIANHNKLLGRIKGVDGIKTGYTRASGFNLVSSVADGNRRLVAVVMGGASGGARDRRMAELIAANMDKTSTRGGSLMASAGDGQSAVSRLAGFLLPKRNIPQPDSKPDVDVADNEDAVEALEAKQMPSPRLPNSKQAEKEATAVPVERVVEDDEEAAEAEQAYAAPTPRPKAAVDPIATASTGKDGWVVQVGSSPSEAEAKQALDKASQRGGQILASANGFTVEFEKGGITYYRARFGGFASQAAATQACGALKRKKVECYATVN